MIVFVYNGIYLGGGLLGVLWIRIILKSEKVLIIIVEGKGGLVSDVWYIGFVVFVF